MNAKRQDPGRDPRSAQYAADYAAGAKAAEADLQYFNEVAEATVLAALLRGMPQVDDLDPNLFHRAANQVIADRIIYLRATSGDQPEEDGLVVGMARLVDDLIESGQLEAASGQYYVSTVYEMARPMARELDFALKVIERNFYRRRAEETRSKLTTRTAQWAEPDELARLLAECRYWEELAAGLGTQTVPAPIKFTSALDAMNTPPACGIVGDLLYEDSIAELYAPSGTWKSFIAIGMGLHIVTGLPWYGRAVKGGHVVYVAAESGRGVGKRMRAWCRRHSIAEEEIEGRFHLVTMPVKLTQMEVILQLIASIKAQCGDAPVLVVFDTLARSVDGSTNDDEVMNAVLDSATAIRAEFGCCVLIVHHTGKDTTRGSKGNNALPNGVDTIISIKSRKDTEPGLVLQPGDTVTLTCEKPKDEEPFEAIAMTTEKVMWTLDDGRSVSSLVAIVTGAAVVADTPRKTQRLKTSSQTALVALSSATNGYKTNEWWHASGLKKSTFMQWAKPELLSRKLVVLVGDVYRLTEAGEAQIEGPRTSGRVVPFRPA